MMAGALQEMIADTALRGATMMMTVIDVTLGTTVTVVDTMTLAVREALATRMIDVDEMMITGPCGRIVVMIGVGEIVAGAAAVASVMTPLLLTVALQLLPALAHYQNVPERLRVGTYTPLAMNNTPHHRQKLQVTVGAVIGILTYLLSASGLFNLPGANRAQPVPGSIAPPADAPVPAAPVYFPQAAAFGGGGNPNLARQSRRLYVGGITYSANEENISAFFNAKMVETGLGTNIPGDAVVAVQVNHEKSYAFVEVRF